MFEKYKKVYKADYEKWYKENEAYRQRVAADQDRLKFHLMPKTGWLNDPNGLCQFNGTYHIYYQYTPFEPTGELKTWGHYTTKDFIHYEDFGPVVFPDEDIDAHGVYSGSAFIEDGKMYVYYTGNVKLEDGDFDYINTGREANTVLVVSEDGKTFGPKKELMRNVDYPSDLTCHVRDPKVWKEGDIYYMIQGARTKEDVGQALIFESKDKINWKFRSRVESEAPFGYMWECPDYFEVDGHKILSTSVQGLEGGIWDDRNVYQSGYFLINGSILEDYKLSEYMLWDYGFDYYAPQSFETEDGRRVHISWMGMPDCEEYTNLTIAEGWKHCFTFPREVFVEDGKVRQRPVRELQKRKTLVDKSAGMLKKDGYKVYDVNISGIQNNEFRTVIDEELILEYKNGRFEMHFTSQDKNSVSAGRVIRYVDVDKISSVEILVDKSSVEVFVNNGEYVFTTRFYPQKDSFVVEAAGAEIVMEEIR